MAEKDNQFALIALVAIVAVVGIVGLVFSMSGTTTKYIPAEYTNSNNENSNISNVNINNSNEKYLKNIDEIKFYDNYRI